MHIPPRDLRTGRFIKIHPDRPKPPKQPALPILRDVKGRFILKRQLEPIVQQPPIQIRENQKAQKPIGELKPIRRPPQRPPPPPPRFRDGYKPVPAPSINKFTIKSTIKPTVKPTIKSIKITAKPTIKPTIRITAKPTTKPKIKITTNSFVRSIAEPVPKITKLDQAVKGHAESYKIEIQDSLDPLNHFTETKEVVESHLKDLL